MGPNSTPPVALGFPDNDPDFEQSIRIGGTDCSLKLWKGHVQEGREETAAFVRVAVFPTLSSIENDEKTIRLLRVEAVRIFAERGFDTSIESPLRQGNAKEDPSIFYLRSNPGDTYENSQQLFERAIGCLERNSETVSRSYATSGLREKAVRHEQQTASETTALDGFVERMIGRLKTELGSDVPPSLVAALFRVGQAMLPRDSLVTSLGPDSEDIRRKVDRALLGIKAELNEAKIPTAPLARLTVALEDAFVAAAQKKGRG